MEEQITEKDLAESVALGAELTNLKSHLGWQWFHQRMTELMSELDSLKNVETIAEIRGRRHALRVLNELLGSIEAKIHDGVQARQAIDGEIVEKY